MRKFWSGFARFFAVLFAIAFVLTSLLALLLNDVDRRLLVSATYKTALARQQVYALMPRLLAEQLVMTMNYNPCASNPLLCENLPPEFISCAKTNLGDQRYQELASGNDQPTDSDSRQLQACLEKYAPDLQSQKNTNNSGSDIPAFFKSLSVSDLEAILADLVPPAELKSLTESVLDQTFAYMNGERNGIVISLVGLKQNLSGPAGLAAIQKLIRSQPACSGTESADMQAYFATGEGTLTLCHPNENTLQKMTPDIQATLRKAADQIQDTRSLSPQAGVNPADFGALGSGPVGGLRFARLVMRLSPDVPLLLLLWISLLAVRNPKSWLRWWGIPFFISGLLTVGLGISFWMLFEEAWLAFLAGRLPPYLSLGTVSVVHDLFRAILSIFVIGLAVSGGLLALLGLGMWIGSGFIRKPSGSSLPAETLPTSS